jgi:DNA gyrase inhibitor GyrI/DNA-binding HxlR family transcriptional regulator
MKEVLDVSRFMSPVHDDRVWNTLDKSGGDIAFVLGSLANTRRLQLLTSLLRGPQTFSALQKVTGLHKTALAHHLKLLLTAGILQHIGKGRYELTLDGSEFVRAVGEVYASSRRRRELDAAKRADYIQKVHTKQKEPVMKEFEVRIEQLEPMRVASAQAISETPENDAWAKMRAWAEPLGLLEDLEKHPVFGFNNLNPSPGRKEYGYEFWIRVEPDIEPEGEITIEEFRGGLYAVTTCRLKEELESEFFQKEGYLESWKKLVDWVDSSKYRQGKHQCLERAHDPNAAAEELVLDLYYPIET